MSPRPAPATQDEVLDVLAQTYSGRNIPRSVGAVADDIARARGWDGYTTRSGEHNNRMTTAQFVAEWVSQASVARALDAAIEDGKAVKVTADDGPYARSPHVRKGSTYYMSTEAHVATTEAWERAQTAHLRTAAEGMAVDDLIAAHEAEYKALVQKHMDAEPVEPKTDLDTPPAATTEDDA